MIVRCLAASVITIVLGSTAMAQPTAVHKTILQTQPFPAPSYNTVTVRTLVDRGGTVGRHTHPGVEMAYIVSGEALVKIAGRADQTAASGDTFAVPAQTPHSVQNIGRGALTIISTYVVEKSQPIASPAPLPGS